VNDEHCDQHLQAAAYLLGALEPDEANRYREHLHDCPDCQEQLQRLQPAASQLADFALPIRFPQPLIGGIMAKVRADAELLAAAGPDADRVARSRWSRPRRLTVAAVTGAIVAAAAAIAITLSSAPSKPKITPALITANLPGAHAQLRQTDAQAELEVTGIPQPPPGKVYEVWLAKPHGMPQRTDALFSPTGEGDANVDVPGDLHDIERVMVTAEPVGGSAHPTSPPIIIATLKIT
jgi:anti-sigma-K factor RskA